MVSDSPGTGKYVRNPPTPAKDEIARVGHPRFSEGKRLAHLPSLPKANASRA